MLHNDYTSPTRDLPPPLAARQTWMALLARAPEELLEKHLASQCLGNLEWLRPSETGLMMVQGRAGGTGQRFNLGEVSLTRCVLKPDAQLTRCQQVGVAYVMGGLELQGGVFDEKQVSAFEDLPYYAEAVRLRRYDDLAKVPGHQTPDLAHFEKLMVQVSGH